MKEDFFEKFHICSATGSTFLALHSISYNMFRIKRVTLDLNVAHPLMSDSSVLAGKYINFGYESDMELSRLIFDNVQSALTFCRSNSA